MKGASRIDALAGFLLLLFLFASGLLAASITNHKSYKDCAREHIAYQKQHPEEEAASVFLTCQAVFLDKHTGVATVVATWGIALFTLMLVIATLYLWDAGERQMGIAEAAVHAANNNAIASKIAAEATQRSTEVLITQARPVVTLDLLLKENVIVHEDALVISIAPRAKNIGASAAVDLRYGFFIVPTRQGRWTLRELIENVAAVELRRGEGQILVPGESMPDVAYMSRRFSIGGENADIMSGASAIDLMFWVAYRFMFGDGAMHFTAKYLSLFERGATPGWLGIEPPRTIEKELVALVTTREIQD
jgi:hypothetical protein